MKQALRDWLPGKDRHQIGTLGGTLKMVCHIKYEDGSGYSYVSKEYGVEMIASSRRTHFEMVTRKECRLFGDDDKPATEWMPPAEFLSMLEHLAGTGKARGKKPRQKKGSPAAS